MIYNTLDQLEYDDGTVRVSWAEDGESGTAWAVLRPEELNDEDIEYYNENTLCSYSGGAGRWFSCGWRFRRGRISGRILAKCFIGIDV